MIKFYKSNSRVNNEETDFIQEEEPKPGAPKINNLLTKEEQSQLKARILETISHTPQLTPLPKETVWAHRRFKWQDQITGLMRFGVTTAIIVFAGIGTAYVAHGSQPGDTLFPVKLLGETVELGISSINDAAFASVEAKIAERRLDERIRLQVASLKRAEKPMELISQPENVYIQQSHTYQPRQETGVLVDADKEVLVKESDRRFAKAMEALTQTKEELEQRGKTQIVQVIQARIDKISSKLESHDLKNEKPDETDKTPPKHNDSKSINKSQPKQKTESLENQPKTETSIPANKAINKK